MTGLDGRALLLGAAVGLAALAVVAGIARLADSDSLAVVVPLLVLALAGLVAAGWVAGARARRAPLRHAAGTAILAVVAAAMVAAAAGDLAAGPAVTWLLLATAMGTAGGLAALRPRRRAESAP